ncbi:MAG: arylsulfatase [Pricia sp.]
MKDNVLAKVILAAFSLLILACKSDNGKMKKKNPLANRPNIIVILVDDMGYSDIAPFGGEIPTPNLQALAESGLKMTQFYNAGRCCPTRASLLTGLYQHQAGVGFMDGPMSDTFGNEVPAYQGYLNENCVTMGEVLGASGYQTYLSGKWHVGREKEQWPSQRGFDESYTFVYGAGSYFNKKPYRPSNRESVIVYNDEPVAIDDNFYLTSEISERAVAFIKKSEQKQDPFFMYLAYTAPHWPLHALEKDIALFRGKYMGGWDSLRNIRHTTMLEKGIVKEEWGLSPSYTIPPDIKVENNQGKKIHLTPKWDTLSLNQKRKWDLRMAVYAAMVYRMDVGIGKIVKQLKEQDAYDNTLIMFMSDNGACHEPVDTWNIVYDQSGVIGSPESFDGYSYPWANASNTPFRLFKHWTAEGGIATPFIASWPEQIEPGSVNTTDYAHIIDIMATCVDVAEATYPTDYRAKKIKPMEGKSLMPIFKNGDFDDERLVFWEHRGNMAVRKGDWKLVKQTDGFIDNKNQYQLFNLRDDRAELWDVIDQHPEIKDALLKSYDQWADRVGVERNIKW